MKDVHVTLFVTKGFIATELALAHDILRIANRLHGETIFVPKICTTGEGGVVEGMGGVMYRAEPLRKDENHLPNHLVVLGGFGIRAEFNHLRPYLRWVERMGSHILLLSEAASEWVRLYPDNEYLTAHWEVHQLEAEADTLGVRDLPLYSRDRRISTAAGMMSTADVFLNQIVAPVSQPLAQAVAQVLLINTIRGTEAVQPRSEYDVAILKHLGLEPAITAMECNMSEPLGMTEIASEAGFSIRQLERKFKTAFGQTPAAFYRSLRLRRARALIEQTAMSIVEIAESCGFGSSSSFAKMFVREFGVSPSRLRAARKMSPEVAHLSR